VSHAVFISYCAEDRSTAEAVCATLEAGEIRCFIAPRDVLPGRDYAETLIEAIREARLMVLVYSSRSNNSKHVVREVERAAGGEIPILPLRIEKVTPCASLEYYIGSTHFLDALTQPLEQHLPRLVDAVESLLAGQAPGSLQSDDVSRTPPETPSSAENPLHKRVFVGREAELNRLQNTFDDAASGQGSLVMVVGEPGIGKTTLCEQLAAHVISEGGTVLLGHCYEEGSLSLPYLAFVETLRSYVMTRPIKNLQEELGDAAEDVARIVPEIRDKLKVKPKPKIDPEEERYRLMQGVSSFLANAASVQPLLVVLEDLHDADKATLDMLTHVSRNLSDTRVLIIGTYRDVDVDRSHPLSAALAELRRSTSYDRILLRGLNPDEVHRMLEDFAQKTIPWSMSEAVHRQTEGNPLFVQEVMRYLADQGLLGPGDKDWKPSSGALLEMSMPEGLRDVIGRRLSILTEECSRLLSVAAVIGREFSLDTLQAVVGMDEARFLESLEEAVRLSVLEERPEVGQVRYRFAHAFFRQVLYEELIAPQRLRLHQQIARALEEQYGERLQEHASELAEHFFHSTDPADLEKAVHYGEMAARAAVDVYAYGEAARLLEQTIKVQQVLDPEDKGRQCDLLLELCDALLPVLDTERILTKEAPAAFSLAEALGDSSRTLRACMDALLAIMLGRGDLHFAGEGAGVWLERIDSYAEPDTVERAYADACLGSRECWAGDMTLGLSLLDQALDLARRTDNKEALWHIAGQFLFCAEAPEHVEKRCRIAEEFWANSRGTSSVGSMTALFIIDALVTVGHRQLGEEVSRETRNIAERTGNTPLELFATTFDACFAIMDGHLEEANRISLDAETRAEGAGAFHHQFGLPSLRARSYLGGSMEGVLEWISAASIAFDPVTPLTCLVQAYEGRMEEAVEILEANVMQRPNVGTQEDVTFARIDTMFLEAAVLAGHLGAAELLLKRLDSPGVYVPGLLYTTCVPRHLGGAAALLGRYDEARQHYDDAIKICTEMPYRPELALSKLELGELLLEHYHDEEKEALSHLDFAIGEFREMKMQPSLERALRLKEALKD